jgi:hypothetical protein
MIAKKTPAKKKLKAPAKKAVAKTSSETSKETCSKKNKMEFDFLEPINTETLELIHG